MCGSMADIQSPTAEIRRRKKEDKKKKKLQDQNIMVCPNTLGDHNKLSRSVNSKTVKCRKKLTDSSKRNYPQADAARKTIVLLTGYSPDEASP